MRKWLIMTGLAVIAVMAVIVSCSKNDQSSSTRKNNSSGQGNDLQADYVQPVGGGGSVCNCPYGWASCAANCWFSDCCICWDPQVSEGSCGCYFGIALCKTGKKGTNGSSANTDNSGDAKNAHHKVVVYPGRIREFLRYLEGEAISVSRLGTSFETLVRTFSPSADPIKSEVAASDYEKFSDEYSYFINQLSVIDKDKVVTYVNEKSKAIKK